MKQGFLITFEGPEGCGKSTQIRMLADYLAEKGLPTLFVREPGGTVISEQIRNILLDPERTNFSPRAELLLFEASRAQIVDETIRPALGEGIIVMADRFYDSTTAYQGYGRGFDLDMVHLLNMFATGDLRPDLTLYLDLVVEEGLRRRVTTEKFDRLDREVREFHQRVREGYLQMAHQEPERWRVIDASQPIEEVFAQVRAETEAFLVSRHPEGQQPLGKERL
jgi:dTMP kinase